MNRVILLLAAIACLLQTVTSLGIDIPAQGQDCFFEDLDVGDKLTVSYQVGEDGSHDINFWIVHPNGQRIISTSNEASGNHILEANNKGRYSYCFDNSASSSPKSVSFNVHDLEKIKESAKVGIDPLESVIRELAESIFAIKDEQEYIVARERVHRNTAESTNSRVKWWSLGQLTLLVVVCFSQIYYLKRFFEVKRAV